MERLSRGIELILLQKVQLMNDICQNLLEHNYDYEQVYQLLFLYNYNPELFFELTAKIDSSYSVSQLEQLIKCITHNIPYKILLSKDLSVEIMIEIRRYLEDSFEYSQQQEYLYLARKMIDNDWSPNLIYEFRRIFKSGLDYSYQQILKIFDIADNTKHWVVIACLYNVAFKYKDIEKALSAFNTPKIFHLISRWTENNDKEALIKLMEEKI